MSPSEFISKEPIDKGWSCDKKYCATARDGTRYLLRITPKEKSRTREELFRMQQRVDALGVPMCRPVACGACDEGVYIIQTWVDGRMMEDVLPELSDAEAYHYGLEAGKILKKIHTVPAPETQPDWEARFNAKMDRKIRMYQECPVQFDGADRMLAYIEANRHLLAGRPQCFQHGDYHVGNMMMEDGRLVIIDFDRYDFGDPWEEFNRIVWCAQAAPVFASGMVNGYFDGEVPGAFWRLLALYICSNTLSSVPWAVPFGEGEIQTMLRQAGEVLDWYDQMQNPVPSWYFKGYYLQYMDGLPYKLKAPYDFGFIGDYGRVFRIFDDQDSGNICFGTQRDGGRLFVKYAGAPTEAYPGTPADAVARLAATVPIYRDLRHPNLIELVEAGKLADGFGMVFKWADGDCMGRMYPAAHRRFMQLPVAERMKVFDDILAFLDFVNAAGYVAVDFYDGSILYDFENQKTTFCDIDLFRKKPCENDMGRMWGSSRFMSPEEFCRGAALDEVTNVYTAGAFAFALFGECDRAYENWPLGEALYRVAKRATADERGARQQSIAELKRAWENAKEADGRSKVKILDGNMEKGRLSW